MFITKLDSNMINQEKACCTGKQAYLLLKDTDTSWTWYAADVLTNNNASSFKEFKENTFKKVGKLKELLDKIKEVDQFLSGVFISVNEKNNTFELEKEKIYTEESPPLDLKEVLLEIRALDTSYFEVYTNYEEIFNSFCKKAYP